jgi:hypothetical protein
MHRVSLYRVPKVSQKDDYLINTLIKLHDTMKKKQKIGKKKIQTSID